MNTIIQRQLLAGDKEYSIAIKPYDIAWILGYQNICDHLKNAKASSLGIFSATHEKKDEGFQDDIMKKTGTGFSSKI